MTLWTSPSYAAPDVPQVLFHFSTWLPYNIQAQPTDCPLSGFVQGRPPELLVVKLLNKKMLESAHLLLLCYDRRDYTVPQQKAYVIEDIPRLPAKVLTFPFHKIRKSHPKSHFPTFSHAPAMEGLFSPKRLCVLFSLCSVLLVHHRAVEPPRPQRGMCFCQPVEHTMVCVISQVRRWWHSKASELFIPGPHLSPPGAQTSQISQGKPWMKWAVRLERIPRPFQP